MAQNKPYKRKLRNLLIDKDYQLRYTGISVLIAAAICGGLGALVIWQTRAANREFKQQRAHATKLFKEQREQTTKLVRNMRADTTRRVKRLLKVATDMLKLQLKDDDPLVREGAKEAIKILEKDDRERVKRRVKEDQRLAALRAKADKELVSQRKAQDRQASESRRQKELILILGIVAFGMVFLVVIFIFNIVITHKVAGPLFKMGRYMDEVRDGSYSEVWNLRKGDQLVDLYSRFQGMHQALKQRQEEDIEILEAVLESCERSDMDADSVQKLRDLLDKKRKSVGDSE